MLPTLLLCLLVLPLAGAFAVVVIGAAGARAEGSAHRAIRWVSLATTAACLVLAAVVAWAYATTPRAVPAGRDAAPAEFFPEMVPGATGKSPHATTWDLLTFGPSSAVQFYVGVDGLNVWLVLLTALLMVPSVLISWTAVEERVPEFYAWLLVLETGMLGVFLSFDILLFYVFFELTLVPLFFLIGIWGGPQRQRAARKFFIFTLAGSLFTLLGVLGIAVVMAQEGKEKRLTFSIPELVREVNQYSESRAQEVVSAREAARKQAGRGEAGERARAELGQKEDDLRWWRRVQTWLFLAMMVGFAIKVPLVPVHTWLPLAHVEAPTAGSVLLAGVLLKIGAYGFVRLCVPLTPDASVAVGVPLVGSLAVVGVIYGAFCALAQHDIKRLVAYSSVSHLGFCMLGVFALNEVGLTGGLLQMVNHGLSTGALFLLVGMLYERYHTRMITEYGGMGKRLRLLAVGFVFITMSSIGLPGLNGFVGEALSLFGMFGYEGTQVNGRLLSILAASGVVLGAWYMLTLVMRVFGGPVREPAHAGDGPSGDLNAREVASLVPIALACVLIGLYPRPVIDTAAREVRVLAGIAERARGRAEGRAAETAHRAHGLPGVDE
jgi:NADH-quinone oxidoreductase subunit M